MKKTNAQLLTLFASFSWFAQVIELNKDNNSITPELMNLYKKLARLCLCNQKVLSERTSRINAIVKKSKADMSVDFVLLSVSIIAQYYELMRGKKRLYTPMSHKQIIELQDEAMEGMETQLWKDTFDYAEYITAEILKDMS